MRPCPGGSWQSKGFPELTKLAQSACAAAAVNVAVAAAADGNATAAIPTVKASVTFVSAALSSMWPFPNRRHDVKT
jgi:hypothetical protein